MYTYIYMFWHVFGLFEHIAGFCSEIIGLANIRLTYFHEYVGSVCQHNGLKMWQKSPIMCPKIVGHTHGYNWSHERTFDIFL